VASARVRTALYGAAAAVGIASGGGYAVAGIALAGYLVVTVGLRRAAARRARTTLVPPALAASADACPDDG
jgi:hypothetical protein